MTLQQDKASAKEVNIFVSAGLSVAPYGLTLLHSEGLLKYAEKIARKISENVISFPMQTVVKPLF